MVWKAIPMFIKNAVVAGMGWLLARIGFMGVGRVGPAMMPGGGRAGGGRGGGMGGRGWLGIAVLAAAGGYLAYQNLLDDNDTGFMDFTGGDEEGDEEIEIDGEENDSEDFIDSILNFINSSMSGLVAEAFDILLPQTEAASDEKTKDPFR